MTGVQTCALPIFLGADRLSSGLARDTLGAVVKDHEDQELVVPRLAEVVGDRDD